MNSNKGAQAYRILVIDDNAAIHQDFCKILTKPHSPDDAMDNMESSLFASPAQIITGTKFEIDCASQGKQGLEMARQAQSEDQPYALAFVDGRMPPGWDGIETIRHLWQACPDLQIVLCTAYTDYSWQEIRRVLGETDSLLILKKPFDNIEVLQMAHTLTRKWELNCEVKSRIENLNDRVQEKIQEKNQISALLRGALEHSPAGIIISEAKNATPLWTNPAAREILGNNNLFLPEDRAIDPDENWQAFRPDGTQYTHDELPLLRAMVKEDIIQNEEFVIRDGKGHEKWISSTAAPVRDSNGIIVAGILIFQNITDWFQAEKEREELQMQLLHAQKMESIGILTGGVAHDFNNSLQGMAGNVELLLMKKDKAHEDFVRLKTIYKSIDRAAQLTRQLLQFSRKSKPNKQRMDINHEVKETVKLMERTIPKMVSVKLSLDHSTWPIHVDPMQVEQVLLNLGGNAADAMPDGGRLEISTQNVMVDDAFARIFLDGRAGRYVLLKVSDTGCGMNSDTLKHVFDPFFTTKELGKGTGLGLASAYGIIKEHGGHIQCSSEPGHGTIFEIYWPALQEHRIDDCASAPDHSPPQTTGSETILIVDDDETIRELTAEFMRHVGHIILEAANGKEALAIYAEKGPAIDLVILDLIMPVMNGYQCLLELLRQDPQVRVLIASGCSDSVQIEKLFQAGAIEYMVKPYKLSELTTAARKILDDKQCD